MKKTVSIIMALVMLMALVPMSAFATELENNEVLVSVPAGFPETADRVIASFEEDGATIGPIERGANTYNPNNKANVYSDGDGTTLNSAIVDGALKVEYTGITVGQFATINVYTDAQQNQNITADTTMLVFHMDTTGVAAQGEEGEAGSVAIRLTLSESNGNSGASVKAYLLDSEKYYFQADGTEELVEKTTRAADSIWNCYLDAEVGVSGTYYIPVDAFILDENNQATEGACDQAAWDAFVAGCATYWKHNSAINFQFRDYEMVVGDVIVVDDFKWALDYPIDYAHKAVFNDFTYFRPNFNWTWAYGNCSGYSNDPSGAVTKDDISNKDGRFAVTPNLRSISLFAVDFYDVGHNWDESFEAFAFDLDLSETPIYLNLGLRMQFYVHKYIIDGEGEDATKTLVSDSFSVAVDGAEIYFVGEDGFVEIQTFRDSASNRFYIPRGFKGTVVIPKDAVKEATHFKETGYTLHDDCTKFGFHFEILNWYTGEVGPSVYIDNLGFYSYEEIYAVPHACTYDYACSSFCNVCGKPNTAEHTYDGECDGKCNACGLTREVNVAHTYTNTCDTDCNICGATRTIKHTYSSDCDTICNVCGNPREVNVAHTYTNTCDTDCNICGTTRTIEHTYDGDCDEECGVCGDSREAEVEHTFTNSCDTDCNICGEIRTIEHTYDGDCDTVCNICNDTREVDTEHTYTNTCDTDCDICDATRTIEHTYTSDCDTICNVCLDRRYTYTYHSYTNSCDTDCNICGEIRSIYHTYDGDCDRICNICEDVRYVSDDHTYDNACDTDCNVCDEIRAVDPHKYFAIHLADDDLHWRECAICGFQSDKESHKYTNNCDVTCDTCGATREITHNYNIRKYDDDHHWFECECGAIDEENRYGHGYSRYFNADEHWLECFCGHKIENAPHEYDNVLDPICNVCEEERKITFSGWLAEGGKWYFYENGNKAINKWKADSKGWVYLGNDGAMATNKWVTDSNGWCYVGADGYCVTNKWMQDSTKKWCYLNSNGNMVVNNWAKDGGKWYFLDANGYMVSNAWRKDSKGWCYLTSSGAMATNAWVKDSIGWCYVGADGYCVTNKWVKDSKGWCYLNANGNMVINNWLLDGGKWYFMDANGYMISNTSKYWNGKNYYFNASGVCTNP